MAKSSGFVKEFRDFIARGNVIDLAVGVVIGAAFTRIVTSLVEGMLMPFVGLFTGRIDFANKFYVLDTSKIPPGSAPPVSLAAAKEASIPVIAYGQFINDIISFLIVAFVIFLIVKRVNRLWSAEPAESEKPTTKNCPFCISAIPVKATRCPNCTSEMQTA
jgi:large conductance mechanosensitive channel